MTYSFGRGACLLAFLLPLALLAQDADPRLAEHGKKVALLYPALSLSLETLADASAPDAAFQAAFNQALQNGVPRSLLNELSTGRYMKRADVVRLREILPILKADQGKYRSETSIFPEQRMVDVLVKTVETVLLAETVRPGVLAKASAGAMEMGRARDLRRDLAAVDALVDRQAMEKNLPNGTLIADTQWRAGAKPGSRLATTGADGFGNAFGSQAVGRLPQVPPASYARLKSVVPDTFWAPFGVPK